MIVKLSKYLLLVISNRRENLLKSLGNRGLAHVSVQADISSNTDIATLNEELELLRQTAAMCKIVESKETFQNKTVDIEQCRQYLQIMSECEELQKELETTSQELEVYKEWGAVSWQRLLQLEKQNVPLYFLKITNSNLKKNQSYTDSAIKLKQSSNTGYYLYLQEMEEDEALPIRVNINIHENHDLACTINEISLKLNRKRKDADSIATQIYPSIDGTITLREKELHILTALKTLSLPILEGNVTCYEVWVPSTQELKFEQFLSKEQIVNFKEPIVPDDLPPILMKNNKLVRMLEPIIALFALPKYQELDLTPFLTPFFLLFFGFCMGDSGYGVVILVASYVLRSKLSDEYATMLPLIRFFGISTIVMGFLTGTVFGMTIGEFQYFSGIKTYFLDSSNLFNLALILGAVQIIFGVFVRIINMYIQFGFAYCLSSIGWLMVLLATAQIVAEGTEIGNLNIFQILTFSFAGILILFFNTPNISLGARMGKGVWDIYTTATGVFGDLLSYIRLFALSVATGILGLVVNQIAIEFGKIPYIGPLVFVSILIVGHSLNMMIGMLGAFVHSMRLTFVEFYKNAGFTGGGVKFVPFKLESKS